MNRVPVLVTGLLVLSSLLLFGVTESTVPNSAGTPSPSPHLPAKDKIVVYSGASVIDGTGGPPRPDTAIVVRGERIEAVVPAAELKVPAGAEVVNVNGQYALPGFINSHEHLATPPSRSQVLVTA